MPLLVAGIMSNTTVSFWLISSNGLVEIMSLIFIDNVLMKNNENISANIRNWGQSQILGHSTTCNNTVHLWETRMTIYRYRETQFSLNWCCNLLQREFTIASFPCGQLHPSHVDNIQSLHDGHKCFYSDIQCLAKC